MAIEDDLIEVWLYIAKDVPFNKLDAVIQKLHRTAEMYRCILHSRKRHPWYPMVLLYYCPGYSKEILITAMKRILKSVSSSVITDYKVVRHKPPKKKRKRSR